MSSNVVPIDRRAMARSVSAEARRRYVVQRNEKEVAAIKRNRFARLRTTRRWWLSVTAATAALGAGIGASAVLWIQSNASTVPKLTTVAATAAVASVPVSATATVVQGNLAQTFPTQVTATLPVVIQQAPITVGAVAVPTASPAQSIHASPAFSLAASASASLPSGSPLALAAPSKQAPLVAAIKLPARVSVPVPTVNITAAAAKVPEKPTTKYEAVAAAAKQPTPTTSTSPIAAAQTTTSVPYVGIGVPVDGVLQIQVGRDPTVKHVRIGERLPSGEVLRRASSETGQIETSERNFVVKVQ
jgi:hypothetical protein